MNHLSGLLLACLCLFASVCSSQNVSVPPLTAAVVAREGLDSYFTVDVLSDALVARMRQGGALPAGNVVEIGMLRHVRIVHYDYSGNVKRGELVCNKSIADDLISIFRQLYEHRYPIHSVALIDEYGADDDASMRANNSSAFCYRRIKGSTRLSKHSLGLAIDINPMQNPCVRHASDGKVVTVEPDVAEARRNAVRSPKMPHQIDRSDLCYKLFVAHGFRWGGAWRTKKDYQHFEK